MKKLLKRLCSAMVAAVMVMTMAPAAFAAGGGAQFQNGPYLLAPKTNSMVVVWGKHGEGLRDHRIRHRREQAL